MKAKGVFKQCVHYDEYNHYFKGQFSGDETKEVVLIEYHEPQGEGDRHYCDVGFKNGRVLRIFNPDSVEF